MIGKHQIGIEYLNLWGGKPLDQIAAAASAGFDSIGIRIRPPSSLKLPYDEIIGNPQAIKDIRKAAADGGLKILDCEVVTLSPDMVVADWKPVIDTAAALGSEYMQLADEDFERPRAEENFVKICEMVKAASPAMKVCVEFMLWRAIPDIHKAVDFIQKSKQPHAGIVLDTMHLGRSGGTPKDVANMPRGTLSYVQICDVNGPKPKDNAGLIAEARGDRPYPGEGGLPMFEIMDALPDDITLAIECPRPGDENVALKERAAKAMDAMKRFFERYNARKK